MCSAHLFIGAYRFSDTCESITAAFLVFLAALVLKPALSPVV
jgi:hypothetical protein